MRRRSGFSLVEILVVLSVIATILALLMPALRGAAEAARRAQCMNNLKQIHLGLQSYHASHNIYPPGLIGPPGVAASSAGVPWTGMLLPFIEQAWMYNFTNFRVGSTDPANSTVRRTQLSVLECPDSRLGPSSWPRGSAPTLGWRDDRPEFGATSYAACHHEVEKAIDADDHGVFFLNSRIRAADVLDGLSQTIFLGELARPTADGWFAGGRATLRNTGAAINEVDVSALGAAADSAAWRDSSRSPVALENLAESGRLTLPPGYVGGFGSRHRGDGSIFAFGDGSIRFVRATIDQAVYRRLGHRDDGEEVDEDAY